MGRIDGEEKKDESQTYKRDLIEQAKRFIELYIESLTDPTDGQVIIKNQ